MTRQIIAIGGSGLSATITQYMLRQSQTDSPRVCGLATATGDADRSTVRFYEAFSTLDCKPSHISFFARTPDLRSHLLSQNVIYVGGGNTKSMLAVWREWGLPELLREAYDAGIVLAGTSAGAICWFEQGVTDSYADRLRPLDCLGFISGSCCPHYDTELERRPSYQSLVRANDIIPGIALDDSAAAHFIDGVLYRVVTVKPGAGAHYVSVVDGEVREETLPVELLSQA